VAGQTALDRQTNMEAARCAFAQDETKMITQAREILYSHAKQSLTPHSTSVVSNEASSQ